GCHEIAVVRFARREVESLEQVVERVTPVGVAPAGGAVAALQGGGLEQTAVQERQPSQGAGGTRSLGRGPVERAEAQRVEHLAVEVTVPCQALEIGRASGRAGV